MTRSNLNFEDQARRCYDTLALLLPEASLGGILTDDGRYYLVCSEAETRRADGQSIADWFHKAHVPAGYPIEVTKRAPVGAVEVPPRTLAEIAIGKGFAATLQEIYQFLTLAISHDFPLIGVTESNGKLDILLSRQPSATELDELAKAVRETGTILEHEVKVVPSGKPHEIGRDDLLLQPARASVSRVPAVLAALIGEDEEYWRRKRVHLIAEAASGSDESSPWDDISGAACLVGTPFAADNIRRYFSFYSRLVLVAPTARTLEHSLQALRVSRGELTALVEAGHVRMLFPQSVECYDQSWVAELAEANASGLLFSRRLAAVAYVHARQRHPVLFASAPALERRKFIQLLRRATGGEVPPQVRQFFEAMITGLPESWSRFDVLLNTSGAMAGLHGPLVHIASQLIKAASGRELGADIAPVGAFLDWAAALGADMCPADVEGFSELSITRLLVGLHSGFGGQGLPVANSNELRIADNLLAVDNDAAVIEFVRELGASDRDRFRSFIRQQSAVARSDEEVEESIRQWNAFVRKYERNPDRVRKFGLAGIILAGTKAWMSSDLADVVPWLTALAPFLMAYLSDNAVSESRIIGGLMDQLNGRLARVPPVAVLLSRMQKRAAGMKVRPLRE